MKKNKLIGAALAVALAGIGMVGAASVASATDAICVPSDAWSEQALVAPASDVTVTDEEAYVETIDHQAVTHVVHHDAVLSDPSRYSWNGESEPVWPSENWQLDQKKYDGSDVNTILQKGKPGNGDYFYWEQHVVTAAFEETIIDKAAWVETIEHAAVTHVVHTDAVYETVDHPAVVCPPIDEPKYTALDMGWGADCTSAQVGWETPLPEGIESVSLVGPDGPTDNMSWGAYGTYTLTVHLAEGWLYDPARQQEIHPVDGGLAVGVFELTKPEDCVSILPIVVTPMEPLFKDSCGATDDAAIPEVTEGITYTVTRTATDSDGVFVYRVVATADEGYVLADDARSDWTFTTTNEPCDFPPVEPPVVTPPVVTPPVVTPPVVETPVVTPVVQPVAEIIPVALPNIELASTGANPTAPLIAAGILVAVGIMLTVGSAYKRRKTN